MTALCWVASVYVINPHTSSISQLIVITAVLKLGHCDIYIYVYIFKHYSQLTFLAQLSGVARQTDAGERNGSVQTGGPIQTGVRLALIDLCTNRARSAVIPHHPYLVDCGSCVHICVCVSVSVCVYLFHSVAQCIRAHTYRRLVVRCCSKIRRSDTRWLNKATDLRGQSVQDRLVTTTSKNS